MIRLEQNYRSTKNILSAANEVIANNASRKSKTLWTENPEGDLIHFRQFMNGYEEAEYVVGEISRAHRENGANTRIVRFFTERMPSPDFLKRNACLRISRIRS